jgi:hypothetical protein
MRTVLGAQTTETEPFIVGSGARAAFGGGWFGGEEGFRLVELRELLIGYDRIFEFLALEEIDGTFLLGTGLSAATQEKEDEQRDNGQDQPAHDTTYRRV